MVCLVGNSHNWGDQTSDSLQSQCCCLSPRLMLSRFVAFVQLTLEYPQLSFYSESLSPLFFLRRKSPYSVGLLPYYFTFCWKTYCNHRKLDEKFHCWIHTNHNVNDKHQLLNNCWNKETLIQQCNPKLWVFKVLSWLRGGGGAVLRQSKVRVEAGRYFSIHYSTDRSAVSDCNNWNCRVYVFS